jgi:hypothetical protein
MGLLSETGVSNCTLLSYRVPRGRSMITIYDAVRVSDSFLCCLMRPVMVLTGSRFLAPTGHMYVYNVLCSLCTSRLSIPSIRS